MFRAIARAASLRVYPESAAPSLQLDSQLAMGWPQPFAPDVDGKLVVMRSVDAAAVGEYRKLAETVRQAQADRGVKIVMVASAIVGEGKTLTAVNLALTLRQANGRVLLVDADIRGRRIHQLFQVSAGSGLAGCLTATDYGTLPVVDVMPNLTLLPAGSLAIEPSALGSPAMRRLLDDASQRFDWIVIDSPPAVSVPEAGLLAGLVDAAILVIQADRTSQGEVTQALETIGHSRIIGAVLNRASKKAMAEEAASRLVS